MSDISSRVKAIIVDKLGVDENEVVPEASFTNDLGADSLDTVELIMEFEKEFDIQIPERADVGYGRGKGGWGPKEDSKNFTIYFHRCFVFTHPNFD